MAIVISGATGQLGGLVVRHLLARGVPADDVVAAGANPARLDELAALGVRTAAVDYSDVDSVARALTAGDTLLLVSGPVPGARLATHRAIVEAAQRAAVGRLLYTSISRAGEVDTVLAPDHRATELLIADSGLPFTVLRNSLYIETQVPLIVEAAARNEIVTGWGDGRIAGAARADFAEGTAIVLADSAQDADVYEFTGDTAFGGEELALAATELLGKPVTYASRTSDETEDQLTLAGVPEAQRAFALAFDADIRGGAFTETSGTLAALLGRRTTPLVDALRAVLPPELPAAPTTSATPVHGA